METIWVLLGILCVLCIMWMFYMMTFKPEVWPRLVKDEEECKAKRQERTDKVLKGAFTRLCGLLSLCFVALVVSGASGAQDKKAKRLPDKKNIPYPTVTVGNVSYVVVKSEVIGDDQQWLLVLEATSTSGDQKIYIAAARAIAPDGKTFDIKRPMEKGPKAGTRKSVANSAVLLPEGVKIRLELEMGPLHKSVKVVSRLELGGQGGNRSGMKSIIPDGLQDKGGSGRRSKRKMGGDGGDGPLVLQNVPIIRSDE
jgi:hypothetical protein